MDDEGPALTPARTTLGRIAPQLRAAVAAAAVKSLPPSNGWTADLWTFGAEAVTELVAAYNALLLGVTDDAVIDTLARHGIPIESLLLESDGGDRPLITRADLCELGAAATLISADGADPEDLYMPNVPKGSRRRSEVGIDIVHVRLHADRVEAFAPDELVLMASVKHTLEGQAAALRSDVVASLPITPTCTLEYVAGQLRVLAAHIEERHPRLNAQRVHLALIGLRQPPYVFRTGFPVVDLSRANDMEQQIALLPRVDTDRHHFRIIAIAGLAQVHSQCR